MLLLLLACKDPPRCPSVQLAHPLESAKSSVQVSCPGKEPIQLFDVSGGIQGERPDSRLVFCAQTPAEELPCKVDLPLSFDARLPVLYESWESPAQQPREVQEQDWKIQRSASGWDTHGVQIIEGAEVLYSIHVEVPSGSSL